MEFRAHIAEDLGGFLNRTIRLYVVGPHGGGYSAGPAQQMVLLENGAWTLANAVESVDHAGIVLPSQAGLAVAEAFERWQGHALPSRQEIARLEEALAIERARVDDALHAGLNRLDPTR